MWKEAQGLQVEICLSLLLQAKPSLHAPLQGKDVALSAIDAFIQKVTRCAPSSGAQPSSPL